MLIQERKIKNAGTIILICTLLGLLYPVLARELDDPIALLNGILVGFLGGIFIAVSEQNVFKPQVRKTSFINKLIIKSTTYTAFFGLLILGVVSFNRSLQADTEYFQYLASPEFYQFIFKEDFHIIILYTLVLSATIPFVRQISRKMN